MTKYLFYMLLPQLYLILLIIVCLILFRFIIIYLKNKKKSQVKNVDKLFFYRDIPCFKDINLAYWLLWNFSNIKKEELNSCFLGTYLLRWYKNGDIDIKKSANFGFRDNNYSIYLNDTFLGSNDFEALLYRFLKRIAKNNILEKNEMKIACSIGRNKYELEHLFNSLLSDTQKELENKNYISVAPSKFYIFFSTDSKITLSAQILQEYQNLVGLKNFLTDFSNIEEKKYLEIGLWEEYLIFANLLGIADRVKVQFSKLYPNFNNVMFETSFDDTLTSKVTILYKNLKTLLFVIAAPILLFLLVFLTDINISKILIVVVGFSLMIYLLIRILNNKKYNK